MVRNRIRSALPIYCTAAGFVLGALLLPLYTIGAFILAIVLCIAAYILSEKFLFKGRDIEVEEKIVVNTGSAEIDRQIEEGQAQLKDLTGLKTGDETIDSAIDRMYAGGMKIFEAVAQKPEKASQVRKFMNYYLPTTTKLMTHYRTLSSVSGGEHVEKALTDVRSSMGMIADAFEKQLDNLYRLEAMDVSSDIDVMESMISADGLTDDGIRKIMKEDNQQ